MLASASVAGFQKGKYFNRCKRLHPLILHFKSSLDINNVEVTDVFIEEIKRLRNTPISTLKIEIGDLKEQLNNYCIYKQQTMNGE